MSNKLTLVLLAAVIVVAAGCSSDPTSPSTSRVNVFLTDAPIDLSTVNAVNVTLNQIILFGHDDSMLDDEGMDMDRPAVSDGAGLMLNLLDFQDGETVLIATLDVPPGRYQKLRMYVAAAELVMDDPNDPGDPNDPDAPAAEITEPISVPSSKVDIPVTFSVSAGENMDVVLDFDAALSVQVNETQGNKQYILRPVIVPVGMTVR